VAAGLLPERTRVLVTGGDLKRLGEIAHVIGEWPDLAALERCLASFTREERAQLGQAIEAQRSDFLSDGHAPREVPR
jgi:hypothetical protein